MAVEHRGQGAAVPAPVTGAGTRPPGLPVPGPEHVYLDSARHQIREDRLIDRGIDLHDGQLERFAAVGSPLERLEQLERLDQVDKALASLSRQQQQLFELRFIEELPYADIASQLGIAPPLVRKRVQLLRSRLSADFFAGDVSQDRRSRVHS